jgi:hypothetical protein
MIRQSRVTGPCGPALILVHVTGHFEFGRMRNLVQEKSFKIKMSCFKDVIIIISYAVKCSIVVGIPVVVIIVAPKGVVVV